MSIPPCGVRVRLYTDRWYRHQHYRTRGSQVQTLYYTSGPHTVYRDHKVCDSRCLQRNSKNCDFSWIVHRYNSGYPCHCIRVQFNVWMCSNVFFTLHKLIWHQQLLDSVDFTIIYLSNNCFETSTFSFQHGFIFLSCHCWNYMRRYRYVKLCKNHIY